jgi:hypothetical protein
MAKRRTKAPAIVIDPETEHMPVQALDCRSFGHNMTRVPITAARRADLQGDGYTEADRRCANGCGYRRVEVYSYISGETVSNKTFYEDKTYLMASPGGGRLPRREARKALWVRENTA